MKYGNTKYWLEKTFSQRCLQLHVRWDRYLLHDNHTQPLINRNSARAPEPTPLAIFHDSIGVGAELLPKTLEFWYNISLRRLCISLWFIAFWFDFSRNNFFGNKLQCLTSKVPYQQINMIGTVTPSKVLPKKT